MTVNVTEMGSGDYSRINSLPPHAVSKLPNVTLLVTTGTVCNPNYCSTEDQKPKPDNDRKENVTEVSGVKRRNRKSKG
jgi:hypothetical protein